MKTVSVIICILIAGCLVGCSTVGNLTGTGTNGVKTVTPRELAVQAIDAVCVDDAFNAAFVDRLFKDRMATLSVQVATDLNYLRQTCKKPKAERTDQDYGYISASFIADTVPLLTPILGQDAISALKVAGLL